MSEKLSNIHVIAENSAPNDWETHMQNAVAPRANIGKRFITLEDGRSVEAPEGVRDAQDYADYQAEKEARVAETLEAAKMAAAQAEAARAVSMYVDRGKKYITLGDGSTIPAPDGVNDLRDYDMYLEEQQARETEKLQIEPIQEIDSKIMVSVQSLEQQYNVASDGQKDSLKKNIAAINEAIAKKNSPLEAQAVLEKALTSKRNITEKDGSVRMTDVSIWTDEARAAAVMLNHEAGAQQCTVSEVLSQKLKIRERAFFWLTKNHPNDTAAITAQLKKTFQVREQQRIIETGSDRIKINMFTSEIRRIEHSLFAEQQVLIDDPNNLNGMTKDEHNAYLARLRASRDALFLEKQCLEASSKASIKAAAEILPIAKQQETEIDEQAEDDAEMLMEMYKSSFGQA